MLLTSSTFLPLPHFQIWMNRTGESRIFLFFILLEIDYMGLKTRKSFFGVSDQLRLKPICSATETSQNIVILCVACEAIIPSRKRISKVLIRLCGCEGWSAPLLCTCNSQGFSQQGPYSEKYNNILFYISRQ